jgi:uncharacterized protein
LNALFADTSFFLAFLHEEDVDHDAAHDYMANQESEIVTTDWILVELGNYLSRRANRTHLYPFVVDLSVDSRFVIHRADRDDFDLGLWLYHRRPDKQWSMTDCISFNLMQREGMTDALTADHHFEQAGFRILLGN